MSLKRRVSEPAKLYWAIGIAASIALHASGVAGAILLVEDHVRGAAPTEITFSDEASPVATPVPARAERRRKERSRAACRSGETCPGKRRDRRGFRCRNAAAGGDRCCAPQALQPEVMANLSPETVQPAVSPEAADASKAEKATAVVDSQAVAAPASAERLLSSPPADTASPAAETAERIAASAGPERLPSSKPADTASPAGETAEIIAALEQPAGIEPLPAAPVARIPSCHCRCRRRSRQMRQTRR